jgi:polygalacturonase
MDWKLPARQESSWNEAAKVLARIQPPAFPKRDFNVKRYGAVGDGRTDATEAIARSIAECADGGGGRVVIPKGVYLTAPIRYKRNVHLHLDDNATLLFTGDTRRYLPAVYSRWEGVELMNYSACIYADLRLGVVAVEWPPRLRLAAGPAVSGCGSQPSF